MKSGFGPLLVGNKTIFCAIRTNDINPDIGKRIILRVIVAGIGQIQIL